jgi:cytochrome c oxidase subunit II
MKLNKIILILICGIFSLFISNLACAVVGTQHSQLSGQVKHAVRIIEVESFKYGYNPDPIVVKAGEKVKLLLTSKDVTHGFAITDLGINVKVPPNKTTVFEFVPKKIGTYKIYCTVYCGLGHGNMHGTLVVLK